MKSKIAVLYTSTVVRKRNKNMKFASPSKFSLLFISNDKGKAKGVSGGKNYLNRPGLRN
jgi:hypothetical protein